MGRRLQFDADASLHKAMKLFWRKGYESTSMQDLVDELGINRFSIYNTFGDKKAVFVKVLEYYRTTVLAFLIAPLKTQKPAAQRIDDYLSLLTEQLCSDAGSLGCMIQNTGLSEVSSDPEVKAVLKRLVGDLRGAIMDAVEGLVGEEEACSEIEAKTDFVLCQLQGAILFRRATASQDSIEGQMALLRRAVSSW